MYTHFIVAVLGSVPCLSQTPEPVSSAELEAAAPRPYAVEHHGDPAVRERLIRAAEVWHDAGDFLIAALSDADARTLRARGLRVVALEGLAETDHAFVVDLERADLRAEIDSSARLVYGAGRQGVVAVPADLSALPEHLRPGHSCHAGHVEVARRAIRPPASFASPGTNRGAAPVAAPNSTGGRANTLASVDPRIQALVNQVTQANLSSWDQSYSSYVNRNSQNLANFNAAKAQLIAQLQGYGYSPQTQTWNATHGDNVYVEIAGASDPNTFVVLGAHFDTINGSGGTSATAPGADDNTSGSVGVLEIARILSTAGAFEKSIRMVWFSGEEYGLLGSAAHAQAMASQGKEIAAMLNMDMNAYRATGDVRDCDFATNDTTASLTAFCDATSALYVSNWASTSGVLTAGTSDHRSFFQAGFPAAFFFEDLSQYSPYIHTANDAYPASTNDFVLAKMIVQGVLASALTIAQPLDLQIAHTELPDTTDSNGPYPVTAVVTSLYGSNVTDVTLHYSGDGGQSYTSLAMSASGSTWSASIPALGSPKTIYYWIEALDDQGASEVLPEGVDAGAAPFDFFVGTRTTIYATGFEEATDNGWTHGMIATQDDWQRGDPAGTSGDPGSPYAGTKCWGNDIGPSGYNGAYQNNVNNWLRSPVIDCSSASNVTLQFRRWLTVESSQYDQARVKVNGTQVWVNPSTGDLIDSSWVPVSIDVSSLAALNPSVQVEFSLQSDGGVVFGGWNVDAFELVTLGPGTAICNAPSVYCTAKVSSPGCTPAIGYSGAASVSSAAPFDVSATEIVSDRFGLLYYGFGPSNAPFQGGTRCVAAPFKRTPIQSSGGTPGGGDCLGQYHFDFNDHIQTSGDPALVSGAIVHAQYWYRDPDASFGTGLTDAISFEICD